MKPFSPLGPAPKKKRSSIRAIDQGTRYDISGNLRGLARQIERGEYPNLSHVVIGMKNWDEHGQEPNYKRPTYTTLGYGRESMPDWLYTVEMMKKRMTGNFG